MAAKIAIHNATAAIAWVMSFSGKCSTAELRNQPRMGEKERKPKALKGRNRSSWLLSHWKPSCFPRLMHFVYTTDFWAGHTSLYRFTVSTPLWQQRPWRCVSSLNNNYLTKEMMMQRNSVKIMTASTNSVWFSHDHQSRITISFRICIYCK